MAQGDQIDEVIRVEMADGDQIEGGRVEGRREPREAALAEVEDERRPARPDEVGRAGRADPVGVGRPCAKDQ
jgi:hypothetical protein